MPIYDFKCNRCDAEFEALVKIDTKEIKCMYCGKKSKRIFPKKAPNFDLIYNPKKDKVDWDGNTSQYYRLYKEAKDRGEKVELPDD